ncbi:MAG: XdhC family protein [Pseudomonadales bacterium]|nr:XdhC family protein [Pseudomonadales bacterium]
MSNQLTQLLGQWIPLKDTTEWVLGTVYKTEGPCYRKAGAMMLFNGVGQQYGLLSGGCLESDIQTHAKKVMQTGQVVTLCYDGSDEDDISFHLGIGCGGTVHIMLQLVNQANEYLNLDKVWESLNDRNGGFYHQKIPKESDDGDESDTPIEQDNWFAPNTTEGRKELKEGIQNTWFVTEIKAEPHILIIGGGLDARPVVSIAKELGWTVTLCDPRPANARPDAFRGAATIIRTLDKSLPIYCVDQRVDAVVIMTHNVAMDAQAIALMVGLERLVYLALLGPDARKIKVLEAVNVQESDLSTTLSGPAGFDIGGELPESIALSILAECHQAIFKPC